MTLYAFDGTWNEDEESPTQDTNVVRFRDVYPDPDKVKYLKGVGTRLGTVGKIFGGAFGSGGKERIREMYEELEKNWRNGDKDIDIIGFSRGAALAVHFANKIAKEGVNNEIAPIRFLGVWDIVGSFGIPINVGINFHDINIGWDIDKIPKSVQHCFHAMALDERRQAFIVTRLKNADGDRVQECWFRGVHSDVGGGNDNVKLSSIALHWMLKNAQKSGINISQQAIDKIAQEADSTAAVSKNFDPIENQRRAVKAGDTFDPSTIKILAVGNEAVFKVSAKEKYNWSGIFLEKDAEYQFNVADDQKWTDGGMAPCGADGWKTEELSWYKEGLFDLLSLEKKRRFPQANWFELIGALGSDGGHYFRIGKAVHYTAPINGGLFTFANDLDFMYHNNDGEILVRIKRIK